MASIYFVAVERDFNIHSVLMDPGTKVFSSTSLNKQLNGIMTLNVCGLNSSSPKILPFLILLQIYF